MFVRSFVLPVRFQYSKGLQSIQTQPDNIPGMIACHTLRISLCSRFALGFFSCALGFMTVIAADEASDASEKSIQSAFASTLVKLDANPSGTEIPVEWTYTNHWDFPLVIDRIENVPISIRALRWLSPPNLCGLIRSQLWTMPLPPLASMRGLRLERRPLSLRRLPWNPPRLAISTMIPLR